MLAIRTLPISDDNESSSKAETTCITASERYIFVSGLQSNYSAPIRAHVLRDHMLKRRNQTKKRTAFQRGYGLKHSWPSFGHQRSSLFRRPGPGLLTHPESTSSLEMEPNAPGEPGASCARTDDRDPNQNDISELRCYPKVSMTLGQGRLDPFSTYARKPTSEEHFLVDHCMASIHTRLLVV